MSCFGIGDRIGQWFCGPQEQQELVKDNLTCKKIADLKIPWKIALFGYDLFNMSQESWNIIKEVHTNLGGLPTNSIWDRVRRFFGVNLTVEEKFLKEQAKKLGGGCCYGSSLELIRIMNDESCSLEKAAEKIDVKKMAERQCINNVIVEAQMAAQDIKLGDKNAEVKRTASRNATFASVKINTSNSIEKNP